MRINHNIAALNTYRQLTAGTNAASKSMEKLSSGLRINRAGDDAAGLAISEKMRGQIRGLEQASRNAQDGISLIQTAEGALNETHAILQRMRELAVQASNGTATDDDRKAIQAEVSQLISEIDRIGNTTQFNTKNLLDGSQGKSVDASAATAIKGAKVVGNLDNGTYQLTVTGKAGSAAFLNKTGANNNLGQGDVKFDETSTGANVGETYTISWDDGDSNNVTVTLKDATGKDLATITSQDWSSPNANQSVVFTIGGNTYSFFIDTSKTGDGPGSVTFRTEMQANYTITNPGGVSTTVNGLLSTNGQVDIGGFRLTVDRSLTNAGPANLVVSGNDIEFQIGANQNQTTKLAINDMRASALGVAGIDVSTQNGAQVAITTIDQAIKSVSEERGKLGALQNRLEHTINNLGTSAENLTAAESRIRDVDYALAA
jgi:flagellin